MKKSEIEIKLIEIEKEIEITENKLSACRLQIDKQTFQRVVNELREEREYYLSL